MLSNKELTHAVKSILGTKKLSARTIRKQLLNSQNSEIKMRRLIWILNSEFRKVDPLEVGSGKTEVAVFSNL